MTLLFKVLLTRCSRPKSEAISVTPRFGGVFISYLGEQGSCDKRFPAADLRLISPPSPPHQRPAELHALMSAALHLHQPTKLTFLSFSFSAHLFFAQNKSLNTHFVASKSLWIP